MSVIASLLGRSPMGGAFLAGLGNGLAGGMAPSGLWTKDSTGWQQGPAPYSIEDYRNIANDAAWQQRLARLAQDVNAKPAEHHRAEREAAAWEAFAEGQRC